MDNNIYKKLLDIQSKLKSPKNQFNKFGNYKYRNCEDILEALKPLLSENKATIMITDKVNIIGGRFYIEATVTLIDIETGANIQTTASAREEETKKGMDSSQITGSTSSYARKYALNGMFCIDDTKDSDDTNTGKENRNNNTNNSNKNSNTKPVQNKSNLRQELENKIQNILFLAAGKKLESVPALLEKHSAFTGKDGKEVNGEKDIKKLSDGRIQTTYGKLQAVYPDIYTAVKENFEKRKKEAS